MAGPWVKKLGKLAIAVLVLGSISILASFALLIFFWTASISNHTWQLIIINNWLNNAVSILSEVLKQAVNFQIGLAAAMCAAIALERFSVVLPEVASCLAIRSGDYSVWNSAFMFWKGAPRKGHISGVRSRTLTLISLVFFLVACIMQADSILLINDIGLDHVPGLTQLSSIPYGFVYQDKVNGSFVNITRRGSFGGPVAIGSWATTATTSAHEGTVTVGLGPTATTVDGPVQTPITTSSAVSTASPDTSTSLTPDDPADTTSQKTSTPTSDDGSATSTGPIDFPTTGPQGVAFAPGGFTRPPSNDLFAAYPMIQRLSAWRLTPLSYPTFAEYHEDAPDYGTNGIDDTGKTLRAFLPYSDAQTRNTLQNFTGMTTVLDARVSCQTPSFANISFTPNTSTGSVMFNGTVVPLHNTSRLFNTTAFYDRQIFDPSIAQRSGVPAPFSCVLPTLNSSYSFNGIDYPFLQNGGSDYSLALCQLAGGGINPEVSGGLVSEFVDMPPPELAGSNAMRNYSRDTGVAYILLQIQRTEDSYWGRIWGNDTDGATKAASQVMHGQWTDVPFRSQPDWDTQIASATLCYAAFDNANLQITATSTNNAPNRTDPGPKSNPLSKTTIVDFSDVRKQLLGTTSNNSTPLSLSDRGLMALAPRNSWLASNAQEKPPAVSYLRDQANAAGPLGVGNTGNVTLALWQLPDSGVDGPELPWVKCDPFHVYLFQQLLRRDLGGSGSPAHALQALITVLASMSYYAQMPQFTAAGEVATTAFVTANVPMQATGLMVVAAATLVHLAAMVLITTLFLRECRLGMLGAEWQSLLQGLRGEVAELGVVEAMDSMRDGEVEQLLAESGKSGMRVGLGRDAVDGRVHIMAEDYAMKEPRRRASGSSAESRAETRAKAKRWFGTGWRWKQRSRAGIASKNEIV